MSLQDLRSRPSGDIRSPVGRTMLLILAIRCKSTKLAESGPSANFSLWRGPSWPTWRKSQTPWRMSVMVCWQSSLWDLTSHSDKITGGGWFKISEAGLNVASRRISTNFSELHHWPFCIIAQDWAVTDLVNITTVMLSQSHLLMISDCCSGRTVDYDSSMYSARTISAPRRVDCTSRRYIIGLNHSDTDPVTNLGCSFFLRGRSILCQSSVYPLGEALLTCFRWNALRLT